MIVERATGERFGAVLGERVLAPLGPDATSYVTGATLPAPYSHAYVSSNDPDRALFRGSQRIDTSGVTLGIAAASAVVATAEDVARFYRALLRGELLSPETVELMTRKGLGLAMYSTPCGLAYGHDGGLYGYVSYARVAADGSKAAVLLASGYQGTGFVDDLFCARP